LAFIWPSPRDGVVLTRNATEGTKMSAGDVVFRIADLSTVWVLADVPEYDLANVQLGQMATIRVRGLPGQSFQGHVALIYPQAHSERHRTPDLSRGEPRDAQHQGAHRNSQFSCAAQT